MELTGCFHVFMQLLFVYFVTIQCELHAPCFDCEIYRLHHRANGVKKTPVKKDTGRMQGDAPYKGKIDSVCGPCQCKADKITCPENVEIVKDGCNCCYMCARQEGETCSHRDVCDGKKGLVCDYSLTPVMPMTCRAKQAKPCMLENGELKKDGDEWYEGCKLLCTCQNGHYGCVNRCPQESRQPHWCIGAKLVEVQGRCCKEWLCEKTRPENSHQNTQPEKEKPVSLSVMKPLPLALPKQKNCKLVTSKWSGCSATCDYGVSVRETNDNVDCKSVQQTRICIVRPCKFVSKTKTKGRHCKATFREDKPAKLTYKNCTSTRSYRPKYCSDCKRHRNCIPVKYKSIPIQFECEENKTKMETFMWIKKCKCFHASRKG